MKSKDLKSLIIIFKAYQSLQKSVKQSLEGTNINVNEFTTMEVLYSKGDLSTQEIIDTILIPNSSMTYVIEKLKEKQLINRMKHPKDGRIQIISLNQKGHSLFEEIYARHFDHMRSIFDVIDIEEEKTLQTILKKIGKKSEGGRH